MGYITRKGWNKKVYRDLVGKPEGRSPIGRPRKKGNIILKCMLKEQNERTWNVFVWRRVWTSGRAV